MKKCVYTLMLLLAIGCSDKKTLTKEELAAYENEINAWHNKRVEGLKANDGWLNLVGLYWLEQGNNTFGSAETNNVVFPDKIAAAAGHFSNDNNSVRIHVNDEVNITSNGRRVTDEVIFHPDSLKSTILESGSLRWNIIRRENKLGIRLRDLESEELKGFTGIERYPVDPQYNVEAIFEPADSTKTISITNVLGQTTDQPSPGTLVFTVNGKQQRLDVLDGGDEEFFVIFADATSGHETYSGGRFIYVKRPSGSERIRLDFNKAYNPPCVFTPYATCPLPPKQNELSVKIEAGEKTYTHAKAQGVASAP